MIARVWHGWTAPADAGGYERYIRDRLLPTLRRLDGFRRATLLRRDDGEACRFTTIIWFDSLASIAAFAGDDLEKANVSAEAQALLQRWDERVSHHQVILDDGG